MGGPVGDVVGGIMKPFKKLFGAFTPNMPKPPQIPGMPTIDDAEQRRIEQDRLRKRRGRAATILSTEGSRSGSVGVNKLLGGGT